MGTIVSKQRIKDQYVVLALVRLMRVVCGDSRRDSGGCNGRSSPPGPRLPVPPPSAPALPATQPGLVASAIRRHYNSIEG